MVGCKEIADNLSNYISGEVSEELRQSMERHLRLCTRCFVLQDSLRKVVIISGDERTFEVPQGYPQRLYRFLDQHLP